MKKLLLLTSCFVFLCGSIIAQVNKANPKRDKSNPASLRVQSAVTPHTAKKYGNGNATVNALSGWYSEGFEGTFPPAGWQIIDAQDPTYIWEQSTTNPYEGAASAYISYTSTIGILGEDWMILPQFTVASTDSFSFFLRPEFLPYPPDSTLILISTTDSAPSSFTTVLATLAEGLNYPTTTTYGYYAYSLSAYAGQDIYVAIVNINDYGDGIFIDKVSIGTKPGIDATSYSIDAAPYGAVGATTSPTATFLNNGSSTQTFDVTMTITGGYSSTKTITNLAGGGTQQVTFDPWTPATAGNYIITTQTLLSGDANPADDTLSTSVNIMDGFTNYGWISGADMSTAYFDPAAASLNTNDTSYLFHLGGAAAAIVAEADRYAPYNNTWTPINSLTTGAYVAGGAGVNGKVYFIGGYNPNFTPLADNQVYDMTTGNWGSAAAMPIPVGDFAIGIYGDLIYCIAGFDGTSDQDAVQIYNTTTDTWTTGTAYPYASAGLRGGIVGNKIVVSGGYAQSAGAPAATTYVGTINTSNPSNITWAQVADYPSGPISRHGGAGSLITASGLVVFTGGDPAGTGANARGETFGYDVNSNSWKIGPAKITAANNICNMAPVVHNDSLYLAAIGGYDGANALAVNEWLNLGAYQIPSAIVENNDILNTFSVNPNPVTNAATIAISLKQSSNVKVAITDVLGNEVAVLNDQNLTQGKHKFNWNASEFSKGIYFCNVTANGKTITEKVVKY